MFLGLAMGEASGVVFGALIILISLWLLYQWAIKPERESRRQGAERTLKQMRRNHQERLRSQLESITKTKKEAQTSQPKRGQ